MLYVYSPNFCAALFFHEPIQLQKPIQLQINSAAADYAALLSDVPELEQQPCTRSTRIWRGSGHSGGWMYLNWYTAYTLI